MKVPTQYALQVLEARVTFNHDVASDTSQQDAESDRHLDNDSVELFAISTQKQSSCRWVRGQSDLKLKFVIISSLLED
jgi:hypothetical protein